MIPDSIYAQNVFGMHPKVKAIIDDLNARGQIDHDAKGHPWITGMETKEDGDGKKVVVIDILRAGRSENIVMSPRRRKPPIFSFKDDDGYKRMDRPRMPAYNPTPTERPERGKRFESIVDRILDPKGTDMPRKKIKEAPTRVTMAKGTGGLGNNVSTIVDAPTQAAALQQANQAIPNASTYTDVQATPATPEDVEQEQAMPGQIPGRPEMSQNSPGQMMPTGMPSAIQPTKPVNQPQKPIMATTRLPGQPTPMPSPAKAKPLQTAVPGMRMPESFNANRFVYPYSLILPSGFESAVKTKATKGLMMENRYGKVYITITNEAEMTALVSTVAKSRTQIGKTILGGILASMR